MERRRRGGGVFTDTALTLHNTIVAENSGVTWWQGQPFYTHNDLYREYGSYSSASSNNLIGIVGWSGLSSSQNNLLGTEGSPLDPGLTSLGDHGGPTATHALLAGSLAIDAGNDAHAIAFDLLTDQRGEDRIDDGDDDTLHVVDIGALELAADEYFGSV